MPVRRRLDCAAEGEPLIRARRDPEGGAAQEGAASVDQAGGRLESTCIRRLRHAKRVIDGAVIAHDHPHRVGPVAVELRRDDGDRPRGLVAAELIVRRIPPVVARAETARRSHHSEADSLQMVDLERTGQHEGELLRCGRRRPVQDRHGVGDRQARRHGIDPRAQGVMGDRPPGRIVGNLGGESRPHHRGRAQRRQQNRGHRHENRRP